MESLAAPVPAEVKFCFVSNALMSNSSNVGSPTTSSLEAGISGMSLVSGLPEMEARQEGTENSGSVAEQDSSPGSNSSPVITSSKVFGKPPGLAGAAPTTKPTHRKNNSSNSPSLTLTPNSSVDGNSDWNSLGNRPSPFRQADAPSLPHLQADGRREDEHSAVSFDVIDNEDDGLRGLEALRDRAYSSPGPQSQSPTVSRSSFSGHISAVPRPPRSATTDVAGDRSVGERSTGENSGQHGDNRSVGDRSIGSIGHASFPSAGRSNDVSSSSLPEQSDLFGLGAIGRPELRLSATEYEPRRRSASSENFQTQGKGLDAQGVSQKFGSLPSLNEHLLSQQHQHPVPSHYPGHSTPPYDVPRPNHVRSVSQPAIGPSGNHGSLPQALDPRFGNGPQDESFFRMQRSASVSYQGMPPSFDGSYQGPYPKRSSLPNISSHGYPPLQRRDALDYAGHPSSGKDGRSFAPSVISPAQSPHPYGHTRGYSDHSMTTSPMSLGSGAMRAHHAHSDEDLTHPLVGEHIDVPGDQMAGAMGPSYPHHPMRNQHGHMEPMSHYGDRHRHSHMGGPSVVYNIKFKRSQRNFVIGPRVNRDLKIGTYVKVEADRGEDLGIVVGKIAADKFNYSNRSAYSAGMGPPGGSSLAELKLIVRLATREEVSLLTLKREEEDELLKICRAKVVQRRLPMNVVDAEYQFDRHKLTFFFEAEGRVDFRELVRDLFSMYKTRIWMQQLDKTTSTASPAMTRPPDQSAQMDFGTPIIAPASEFADSVVFNGLSGGDGGY